MTVSGEAGNAWAIAFGPFQADPALNRLTRDGRVIELRPQAFHVLKALAETRGRYVDYEHMLRAAWGGTVVSKHTVAVTVGEVKRALQEFGPWISYRPKLGYRLDVPRSDDLIKKGWHFAARHTCEGLGKAICHFQQAAEEDPGDFRAYEGMSSAYLLLATWGMRSPRETYSKFLDAHSHAVAMRGLTPDLRANRAHGLHVFERRFDEAEAELLAAQKEQPNLAAIEVRLAVLYCSMGRLEDAERALRRVAVGGELDPFFASTRIVVRICQRDFAVAVESGRQALELHPYHQLSRFFYADALECAGRFEEALTEYRHAGELSPDLLWLRAMECTCFAKLGRQTEALAILRELQETRAHSYVDPYHMALLREALGQREAAMAELQLACEENSSMLHMLDVDPKLDSMRADAGFLRIRERAFPGPFTELLAR